MSDAWLLTLCQQQDPCPSGSNEAASDGRRGRHWGLAVLVEETRKNSEETAALRSCTLGSGCEEGLASFRQVLFPQLVFKGERAPAARLECVSNPPQSLLEMGEKGRQAAPCPRLMTTQWQSSVVSQSR